MSPDTPRWAEIAGIRSPDVLAVLDDSFCARWVSPSVEAAFGYRPEEVTGYGVADLVHLDDLGPTLNAIAESRRRDGRHESIEVRLRDPSGTFVPTRIATTTFEEDGATWWVLSIRPVADDDAIVGRRARLQLVAHETALACSEMRWDELDRLVVMLETVGSVIGATSVGVWAVVNGKTHFCTGWSRHPDRQPPAPLVPLELLRRETYVLAGDPGANRPQAVEVNLSGRRRDGGVLVAELTGSDAWDDHNADLVAVVGGLVLAAFQRAQAERELSERSETDALTGLLNSSALKDRINQSLDALDDARVAVVFGDLDGFKTLNDRLGHRTGDAVLVGLAARLRSAAGDDALLARVGGDEFVVARTVTVPGTAERLLVSCRDAVRDISVVFPSVDMSMGLSVSAAGDTAEDLLHRADLAMYVEKRQRRRSGA